MKNTTAHSPLQWTLLLLLGVASISTAVAPRYSNEVSITIDGKKRIIRSNGIPNHDVGEFPRRGNPNTIAPQNYTFEVPAEPKVAVAPTKLTMQPFGVAVNGVVFDPFAAEWWNGDPQWQYEPLAGAIDLGVDDNNAHVQPNGAYHYHAMPVGLYRKLAGDDKPAMILLGWAADGFPIYSNWGHTDPADLKSPMKQLQSSYRVKKGSRDGGPGGRYDGSFVADYEFVAGSGDLDECNGRTGVTPEFPNGTYHYVITTEFPFIPRLYKGEPDPSFERHGPPQGGGPGMGRRGGPGMRPGPPPPPDGMRSRRPRRGGPPPFFPPPPPQ